MKILIAPLNWGLGHATRSIPIIRHYLAKGDEVVLGGDGESILLLKHRYIGTPAGRSECAAGLCGDLCHGAG